MWYIAFTLGLFGSLHCLGMCGPLAIAFTNREGQSKMDNLYASLSYNLGRTLTYAFIGLFFGLIGSFVQIADLQKGLSIILGVLLVVFFLFSIDIDKSINGQSAVKKYYFYIRNLISSMMAKSNEYHSFQLGLVNGLLPCGLVYLALAGALATGSVLGGVSFMFLFGLGTIPMLFALTMGFGFFSMGLRKRFRHVLPYVTLIFGVFLIYRGFAVDLPASLSFWEAINSPVMCH